MCFFIQSCEPLGKKKKHKKISTKKKAHRSFMSLVSFLPPLRPPLHTSQLTETWQWPTCMCWQPQIIIAVLISFVGLGENPAPYFFSTLEIFSGSNTDLCLWSRVYNSLGCTSQPICSVLIPAPVQCSSWPFLVQV